MNKEIIITTQQNTFYKVTFMSEDIIKVCKEILGIFDEDFENDFKE